MIFTRFTADIPTPSLWRVTFDHPPINLIDHVMIGELGGLLAEVERNEEPSDVELQLGEYVGQLQTANQ
jgi:hypothetical protein